MPAKKPVIVISAAKNANKQSLGKNAGASLLSRKAMTYF